MDASVDLHNGIDVLYNNTPAQRFAALDELSVADWNVTTRNELNLVYYTVRGHERCRYTGGTHAPTGPKAGRRDASDFPARLARGGRSTDRKPRRMLVGSLCAGRPGLASLGTGPAADSS